MWDSLVALALILGATLVLKGLLHALLTRLSRLTSRLHTDWDDIVIYAFMGTKAWAIFTWLAVAALPFLNFHSSVRDAGRQIAVVVTGLQIIIWGLRGIGHWRKNFLDRRIATDTSSVAAIGLLGTALQALLVVLIALLALSNLGVDIGALIAGLGIGGIAVALAAQNILGDLLASMSIVLDKPFVVGDFIVVGDKAGTVMNIGVKTTRLRSLSGEELVFANKFLLESQVQNFKRMHERRVVLKFGVTYSTSEAQLKHIPGWVRTFVESDEGLRFDRCHFSGLGASSLDFELVYYVKSSEFNDHMDRQQRLLLSIFSKLNEEKVEFAFPSTSVYVEKLPTARVERAESAPNP